MKFEMKTKALRFLSDIQTGPFGSQLHKEDYVDDGTPIVTVEHLGNRVFTEQNLPRVSNEDKQRLSKYILKEGDIVFSRVGSVDRCSFVDSRHTDWLFSGRCLRVRPFEEISPLFLYYFFCLESTKKFMRNIAVGATMPSINTKLMGEIEVSYPDKQVQEKIANLLGAIDDKIELNNAINDNLEQQARALYQRMFIDNPVSGGYMGTLSDIADITMGQSPNGSSYNEDGNGAVFFQGRAEFGFRFPSARLYTTEPKRMACANDTLMSVRAPVGDLNVAYTDCCIGRGLAAIHSKSNQQSFVLYTMFSLHKQLDVFNGEGTVFGSINRTALTELPIFIQSDREIVKFEAIVAPIDAAIRNNYEEICRLEKIRDALLPKLMSGELDVSSVEL